MISVVIPLYNKSDKIKRCIDSVLEQTFKDFEIIIINDGSIDNSLEIVKMFKDFRIKIYTTENKGVVSARNFGIKASNFQIVAFLDADDFWLSNHLETLSKLAKDFPEAGLYTTKYSFLYSKNESQQLPTFSGIPERNWRGYVKNFYQASGKYRLGWTGSIAIPKHVLNKVGGFDETMKVSPYGEDIKLWTKIAIIFPVAYDTTHTCVYDLSGENHLSKNNFKNRTYAKFDEFIDYEKKDKELKKYLDMFRTEFALKQKISGNILEFKLTKGKIASENLNWKEKLLFQLSPFFLRKLYYLKSFLKDRKIKIELHN